MSNLLLASTNPGKLQEMQSLLQEFEVEIVTPYELEIHLEVPETGNTYGENAARKALAFARLSGLVSLGDDSGLEVAVLGGAPGIFSRRFSPKPEATDADRRAYLLEKLHGFPHPWNAKFHCTIALATPGGEVYFAQGECHGEIIPEERGQNGFGYDAIFFIPEIGLTMAELSMEAKNRISHRGRAVQSAIPMLLKLL